jgi:hypothetical protein
MFAQLAKALKATRRNEEPVDSPDQEVEMLAMMEDIVEAEDDSEEYENYVHDPIFNHTVKLHEALMYFMEHPTQISELNTFEAQEELSRQAALASDSNHKSDVQRAARRVLKRAVSAWQTEQQDMYRSLRRNFTKRETQSIMKNMAYAHKDPRVFKEVDTDPDATLELLDIL